MQSAYLLNKTLSKTYLCILSSFGHLTPLYFRILQNSLLISKDDEEILYKSGGISLNQGSRP